MKRFFAMLFGLGLAVFNLSRCAFGQSTIRWEIAKLDQSIREFNAAPGTHVAYHAGRSDWAQEETAGQLEEAAVEFPHVKVRSADLCNLVEDKLSDLTITDNQIDLTFRPHGVLTIRVTPGPRKNATLGLVLAILCGFGASFVNLGLAFGAPLFESARARGAGALNASNAVWMPLMLAGAIPNLLYCVWLLRRNRTAGKFPAGGVSHWLPSFTMAVFWFGSTFLYGISTVKLGAWGAILGWPLFMSLIVITASLLGVATGEWKNGGATPLRLQRAGVALLVLAVFILAARSRSLA